MNLIQLQYANDAGDNCGGLYLNIDAIAAVRFERSTVSGGKGWCKILMVNGTEFRVLNRVSDVLDDISEANQGRGKVVTNGE